MSDSRPHGRRRVPGLTRAWSRAPANTCPTPPKLRPGLVDLLESFVLLPAAIVGHPTEVLGCNQLCVEVLGRLPPTESEGIFLDEELRRRIAPSWDIHAWHNVAFLRASLARRPHDERLREHVATMRARSEEFDELWQGHDVVDWAHGEGYLVIDHPDVGRLTLNAENLALRGDPDVYGIQVWTAPVGSPDQAALCSLADRFGRSPRPLWMPAP
jgi:hypothetical protein